MVQVAGEPRGEASEPLESLNASAPALVVESEAQEKLPPPPDPAELLDEALAHYQLAKEAWELGQSEQSVTLIELAFGLLSQADVTDRCVLECHRGTVG